MLLGVSFLILGLLPRLGLCGCGFYNATFYCKNINQDDFLEELYAQMDYLDDHKATDIRIEDSDFTTIEKFPQINALFPNFTLENLVITKSRIKTILYYAFTGNHLKSIDLSYNFIENIDFLCYNFSYGLQTIVLSHNSITELDLNCLSYPKVNYFKLSIDNNKLNVINPSDVYYPFYVDFFDVSYNNLSKFSERELGIKVDNLNISYNNLKSVELESPKSVLTILSDKIDLDRFTNKDYYESNKIYTSFIPQNTLRVSDTFSIANTNIETLDKYPRLKIFSRIGVIDFCNTSLTDISEGYFNTPYGQVKEIKLCYNNFSILKKTIFQEVNVEKIDLSFSQIEHIDSQFFYGTSSFFNSLNLIGNLLEDITDICETAQYLTILDLSANKFTKIYSTILSSCSFLMYLNLSQNLIESIEPGSLSNTSLITLNLSKNKLTTLKTGSFINLYGVRDIDLSDNSIEVIEEYAFKKLSSLNFINLSRNKLKILYSHSFSGLAVVNINFEGNDIRYIQTKAFDGLYQMEKFNLSNLGIATLENDSFFNMSKIKTIDLSYNNLSVLNNYIFQNLSVAYINLTGNKLDKIHFRAFHNLSRLLQLNLSNLEISEMDEESFSGMHSLEFIDLRNNYISNIEKTIFKDITVKSIYLSFISDQVHLGNSVMVDNLFLQFNGTLKEKTLSNIYLQYLYIVDSNLDLSRNCFYDLHNLKELHFFNTNVNSYQPGFLNGLYNLRSLNATTIFKNRTILENYLFKDLKHLQNLILSNGNLSELRENNLNGLSKLLKYLHLNGNKFKTMNFTIFNNFKLTYLDLSHNLLTSLDFTDITESLPYLNTLNVSSCLIKTLYVSKDNLKTNSLRYLDLSNNLITTLSSNIFYSFGNLNELYLNSNRISYIDYLTFNSTSMLNTLRLDDNSLSTLKVGIFNNTSELTFLNISDNPSIFSGNNDVIALFNLKELHTLYMDNTGISSFPFYRLYRYFFNLKKIGLNNNKLSCNYLTTLIRYLKQPKIDYTPYNPKFNVGNVEGIICT